MTALLLNVTYLALIVGWACTSPRLQAGRIIREWHDCAIRAAINGYGIVVALAIPAPPLAAISGALAGGHAWLAWKHRNDDDDNDEGRRRWTRAKTRIPRPTLIRLRPIGTPT